MIPRPASTDQLDNDGGGGANGNNASSTLLRSSSRAGTLDGKRSSSRPMSHQSYQHPVYQDIPMPQSKCQTCLMKLRTCLVGSLERAFFYYGRFVAKYPWAAAFACVMLAIGCGAGISRMRRETRVVRIWISEQSSTRVNTDWLWTHYPPSARFASMIFESDDDILTPDNIRAIYRVRKDVDSIVTKYGDTWRDLCQPVPVVKPPSFAEIFGLDGKRKRRKRVAQYDDNEEDFADLESMFDGEDEFFEAEDDFFDTINAVDDLDGQEEKESPGLSYAEYLSVESYPDPYCSLLFSMPTACLETSILELWAEGGEYGESTDRAMKSLTRHEILSKVNAVEQYSGVFMFKKNFTEMLSGVQRDPDNGKIIGAKATVVRWLGRMNGTAAKLNPVKKRGEPIDPRIFELEGEMTKVMLNTSYYPQGLHSYPNTHRSWGDEAAKIIMGDIAQLGMGYIIVFVYVIVMLGRFNCVEHRAWLAASGVLSVCMGIASSYGVCSVLGVMFTPMHNVLPFLLLGIGIDDMFVIVQCWDSQQEEWHREAAALEEDGKGSPKLPSLPVRVGRALQHAGAAITVTSATDVMAFGVGASTVLPALRSFCIFSAAGVVAIYFFQLTFFVACFSIDRRRVESRRNACCCCCRHPNTDLTDSASKRSLSERFFNCFARLLTKWPSKIIVILITIGITAVGAYGNSLLEQRFDPAWFVPGDSYVGRWFAKNRELFPFGGDRVTVFMHGLDYPGDLEQVDKLVRTLENQTDIIDDVDAWSSKFLSYHEEYFQKSEGPATNLDPDRFQDRLSQFLFSPKGGKYREAFQFEGEVKCGEPSPVLVLAILTFTHKQFSGPSEFIPAMNRVKDIIASTNLTCHNYTYGNNDNKNKTFMDPGGARVFPLSKGYSQWETDEVIAHELYRNLALAIACVAVTTLLLLSDLLSSCLVLLSVLLSLLDVAGFMHFWGLTVDTVSACNLVIAIGLTVDYSSHIAHCFMTESGSRNARVVATLTKMGPAVLNGGVSTFLAFILLAKSQSHVFTTFFRVFFLVVTFGLFHGLVVLPVLLSIFGSRSPNGGNLIVVSQSDDFDEEMEIHQTKFANSDNEKNNGQNSDN